MIHRRRPTPYQSEEFLRSRIIIPFDYETSIEAERQDEARARHLFALRIIRGERMRIARRILSVLGVFLIGWGVTVWWCL